MIRAKLVTREDVLALKKRKKKSHKRENGCALVIAGSRQYHGAAIFAGITASRIVDLVYFSTPKENIPFVKNASPEFIVSDLAGAKKFLPLADSVLMGPGMDRNARVKNLVNGLLARHREKKFVLDASALRVLDLKNLHQNVCLTPHANEFRGLFGRKGNKENTFQMAKKYGCIVLLKGPADFISDGRHLFQNRTGNPMMTTGGTGDILAGLIVGFAARNPLLQAAKAAAYLNGYAGDLLLRAKGRMWNASDLMGKLPEAMKMLQK